MQTFLATLLIFFAMTALMAVGVIFSSRPLQGTCGGTGEDCSCDEEKQRECAIKKSHPEPHPGQS